MCLFPGDDESDSEDDVSAVEAEVVRIMSVVYTGDGVDGHVVELANCGITGAAMLRECFEKFTQLPSLFGRQL